MDDCWKKLRRQVQRERRRYADTDGLSKPNKTISAALESAYGSVIRMMDRIEESAAKREP